MTPGARHMKRKYRPSVRLILLALNLAVLALPLAGLVFLRIYENQLVRETESELISQAAVLGAVLQDAVGRRIADSGNLGVPVEHAPGQGKDARFTPVLPGIDLARDELLPPRPEPAPPAAPPDPALTAIGQEIAVMFESAQLVTLSGLRILDAGGTVIGGRGDLGLSFSALPEIGQAMTGRYSSVIRKRQTETAPPAITSISRSAQVRVFIAYPVVAAGRLTAIVYMSRTPENIWRRLYPARGRVLTAGLILIGIAALLAIIASRTIIAPVDALIRQSERLAAGHTETVAPLAHAGTREIARLADSFSDMAFALNRRSEFIRQFAVHVSHEFKTPLTAIKGATELLGEHMAEMSEEQRHRFIANIAADTEKLSRLVERLNQLAKAESAARLEAPVDIGVALQGMAAEIGAGVPVLAITAEEGCRVQLPREGLDIIAANIRSNAAQAGATLIDVGVRREGDSVLMTFADNGAGIPERIRARIFEPLFSSRRDSGGSGLGLRIIRSLIEPHGGSIELADSAAGATFVIRLPLYHRDLAGRQSP